MIDGFLGGAVGALGIAGMFYLFTALRRGYVMLRNGQNAYEFLLHQQQEQMRALAVRPPAGPPPPPSAPLPNIVRFPSTAD